MAAVNYTDGTIITNIAGESMEITWISPATMDANDTVEPTAVSGKTIKMISAFDNSNGDAVTATISNGVITVDASGGDTDNEYVLKFTFA